MKIQAFVILDARNVEFEVHKDVSLEWIKRKAIRIADEQKGSWAPEVQNIEIIVSRKTYSKAVSAVKSIDIHKLKAEVFQHFCRKLNLSPSEENRFERDCDFKNQKKGGE